MPSHSDVCDNTALRRFELDAEGLVAFSNYKRDGDVVTIMHTEVPPALNGMGIGSALVRGMLNLMRAQGHKMVPLCPFVAAYISRHPEYEELLR